MLPTERTGPNMAFPEGATWLVYGPPKVGKTTAACTWPDPLLIECEREGAEWVDAYKLYIQSAEDLRKVWTEIARKVKANEPLPYKTIVLDTIDMISQWIEVEVASQYGAKQLGESKVYGADFGSHRAELIRIIRRFSQLPFDIVLVSHSYGVVGDQGAEAKVLELPKKAGRAVLAEISHIIYLEARELPSGDLERRFVFHPSSMLEAGSRHPVMAAAKTCHASYGALKKLFEEEGSGSEAEESLEPEEPKAKTRKKTTKEGDE